MTTRVKRQRDLTRQMRAIGLEVGNTPLLYIASLSNRDVSIYAKAEWQQLSGSVKARAAYHIIENAIETGKLNHSKRLLDASSGNTAIAYGVILQKLGIGCTICLPSNASQARISMLKSLNVEIILTSPLEGTEGSQKIAREMVAEHPGRYFYADQYNNPANPEAHYHGTAIEILEQTSGTLTHFVAGLGTTGTFTGTASRMKESGVLTVALQPDSPLHIMEGWKHLETADIPGIFEPELIDRMIAIDSDDVFAMIKNIYTQEGLKLSPSSAANLVGAVRVSDDLERGTIVTVLPDAIDRYQEVDAEIFGK